MVTERGLPRRREFVMQVSAARTHSLGYGSFFDLGTLHISTLQVMVCGQSAEGMGPSKKVAKRNAAEKMLELLGYKVPQPQPPKPALKTDEKVLPELL